MTRTCCLNCWSGSADDAVSSIARVDVPIGGNLSTHTDAACGTSRHTYHPWFAGANVGIVCTLMRWVSWREREGKKGFHPFYNAALGLLVKFGGFAGTNFSVLLRAVVGIMGSLILRLHKSQAASSSQFIFLQFVSSSGGNCIYYNCL